MAKKKRQLRLLLLLLAVAVALFVAAFCWNRWQTAQEEAEAEAAVIHVDLVEEPTKLRYSNGTDTITFEKSGESWVSAEETDGMERRSYWSTTGNCTTPMICARN